MGLGERGKGFRVRGLGLRVYGVRFRAWGLRLFRNIWGSRADPKFLLGKFIGVHVGVLGEIVFWSSQFGNRKINYHILSASIVCCREP